MRRNSIQREVMQIQAEFAELITGEEQLREVLGYPAERNVQKVIPLID